MNYCTIVNNQAVKVSQIPEMDYETFLDINTGFVAASAAMHCVNYFGYKAGKMIRLICCIANDKDQVVFVTSCQIDNEAILPSFTAHKPGFEKFEREIHENFGISYTDHPWLKPVRYPYNRHDRSKTIANYPFFRMEGEELHEVGVGPIHAGVIEPGHFRFICNGEQILHLEIQLGYQHRGMEDLFLKKTNLLQRATLAENIAGDSVVGHSTAFSQVWESLCGFQPPEELQLNRTVALELERAAIHTGDLGAICADVAYQLGSSVYGRLRTPLINFFQEWGGNRLAKGLVRPGDNPFPLTPLLAVRLREIVKQYEPDFEEMSTQMFSAPSVLSRLERTGVVSYADVLSAGAVGMSARMSGLNRDIRSSHPTGLYGTLDHQPVIKHHGDVYSRVQIRREEIRQSIHYLRQLTDKIPSLPGKLNSLSSPGADLFALSLVEGWRGEICHCAVTGTHGELLHYKIKDPSFHNWLVLALAVRNNEISDFPVCNKSFNLSYCGHDL